jgi:hypothetical protein
MQTILIIVLVLSLLQLGMLFIIVFRLQALAEEIFARIVRRFGREKRKSRAAAETVLNAELKEPEVVINDIVHEH